jgi:hypothetical protein
MYTNNTASDEDKATLNTEQRSPFDKFSFSTPLDRLPDVLSLLGHKNTTGNMIAPKTAKKRRYKPFNALSSTAEKAKHVKEIVIANTMPIHLSALEVSLVIAILLFHDMGIILCNTMGSHSIHSIPVAYFMTIQGLSPEISNPRLAPGVLLPLNSHNGQS